MDGFCSAQAAEWGVAVAMGKDERRSRQSLSTKFKRTREEFMGQNDTTPYTPHHITNSIPMKGLSGGKVRLCVFTYLLSFCFLLWLFSGKGAGGMGGGGRATWTVEEKNRRGFKEKADTHTHTRTLGVHDDAWPCGTAVLAVRNSANSAWKGTILVGYATATLCPFLTKATCARGFNQSAWINNQKTQAAFAYIILQATETPIHPHSHPHPHPYPHLA